MVVAKTVSLTEARARLSELLDELARRHEHVVITRNGRPAAVLVPAEEQEVLEETLDILQDEEILDALRHSEEDVRAGRLSTLREVRRARPCLTFSSRIGRSRISSLSPGPSGKPWSTPTRLSRPIRGLWGSSYGEGFEDSGRAASATIGSSTRSREARRSAASSFERSATGASPTESGAGGAELFLGLAQGLFWR